MLQNRDVEDSSHPYREGYRKMNISHASDLVTATSRVQSGSTVTSGATEDYSDDGSIVIKISLLLVVTAVVLIVSYKFVVRLFLGYTDRKDDVVPEGFSDDEDSAVIKRAMEPSYEIG